MGMVYGLLGFYLGGVLSHLLTYWIYGGRFILYRDWVDKTLVVESLLWFITLPIGTLKAKQELRSRRKNLPSHKGF
jgi:hypothetical protein